MGSAWLRVNKGHGALLDRTEMRWLPISPVQQGQGLFIPVTIIEALQCLFEQVALRADGIKESNTGAKLQIVGRPENFVRRLVFVTQRDADAVL